jgi:hypothetical protein
VSVPAAFKTCPIVGNSNFQIATGNRHAKFHFGRFRVANNIVQRFFHGQQQVVPHTAVQSDLRKSDGNFEPAGDVRVRKKFLRIAGQIITERLQRVVFRVNGPDDDIQRGDEIARFAGNRMKQFWVAGLARSRTLTSVGKNTDFREA